MQQVEYERETSIKIAEAHHYRVLVIAGGGVRGIIPARILQDFEEKSGKQITQLFDYVVGTSIGGIIAAGITVPSEEDAKKPKYSAENITNILITEAPNLFPHSWWPNFIFAKYSRNYIDHMLNKTFGDLKMSDTLIPVTMVSYSLEEDHTRTWSSLKTYPNYKFRDQGYNHYVKDAAGATSAAPTYFPPKITKIPGKQELIDVDGGIFANSPIFTGISTLFDCIQKVDTKHLTVVVVGTGTEPHTPDNISAWSLNGKLAWAKYVIDKAMKGAELASVIDSMRILENFYYFNPLLNQTVELDDASNTTLTYLKEVAEQYMLAKQDYTELMLNHLLQENDMHKIRCEYENFFPSSREYDIFRHRMDELMPNFCQNNEDLACSTLEKREESGNIKENENW